MKSELKQKTMVIVVAVTFSLLMTVPTFAQRRVKKIKSPPDPKALVRDGDQVWSISTEKICPLGFCPQDLIVKRRIGSCWSEADINDLLNHHKTDELPTVIFIHGNQTNSDYARARGLQIYRQMVCSCQPPPFRMVIWAWPSDDCGKPVKNYLPIVHRSLVEGYAMGWFLNTAQRPEKTRIFAYSLGAQVALSTLEVMDKEYMSSNLYRVASLAPVAACRWPQNPEQRQSVYDRIDQLFIVKSSRDYVVNAYRMGCQSSIPRCGKIGLRSLHKIDCEEKVSEIDVVRFVGRVHGAQEYFKSPCVACRITDYLLAPCDSCETCQVSEAEKLRR